MPPARPWPRPKRRRSPIAVGRLRHLHRDGQALPIPRSGRWMTPNLYSAIVTVKSDGKARDAERVSFGVRTAVFDAGQGLLPQRQAAQDSGHLQPPGSRRRGRGAARPPAGVPARRAAGDGLQRRAHLAQHAHAGVGGSLRPHGHDDDVRDAPDEFQPRRPGAA